jgi:arylsulfatase
VEGVSFAATLFDAAAPQHKTVQYYEMLGSRALWKDGWTAVTWHHAPTDWDSDIWELYDLEADYAQAHDLSKVHPEKLKELIATWWEEARAHNVLPLDDRGRERFYDPTRPVASRLQPEYTYYPDTSPIPNPSMPVFVNCPYRITSNLRLLSTSDSGLIVQQGGWLGGWAIFLRAGRAVYLNNFLRIAFTSMETPDPLPVGSDLALVFEWTPTAVGRGNAAFSLNGEVLVSQENVPTSPAGVSHAQDGWQVGKAWGPSVSPQYYEGPFAFTGQLHSVTLRSDRERQLRLSAEELLRLQRRGI